VDSENLDTSMGYWYSSGMCKRCDEEKALQDRIGKARADLAALRSSGGHPTQQFMMEVDEPLGLFDKHIDDERDRRLDAQYGGWDD